MKSVSLFLAVLSICSSSQQIPSNEAHGSLALTENNTIFEVVPRGIKDDWHKVLNQAQWILCASLSSCNLCRLSKCNFFRASDKAKKVIDKALGTSLIPDEISAYIGKTPFAKDGVMCSPDMRVIEVLKKIPLIGDKLGETNECNPSFHFRLQRPPK
eukprot:Blabericola_migrator_1__5565@NODE_2833_length_2301_cov_373_338406_g1778_i0_p3_GENE_NODE_2833_length_2301_cov_373_338406_g1778_i0NODE_2833_length_2301_cov_373_338406_g1778_i0_p3_ORF_typecomplete_len157_score32_01_NODE_2833_length_2301_cov_373_338406_g1778_i084554